MILRDTSQILIIVCRSARLRFEPRIMNKSYGEPKLYVNVPLFFIWTRNQRQGPLQDLVFNFGPFKKINKKVLFRNCEMLEPKLYMSDHWIVSDNDGILMWIDDQRWPLQQSCFSTESNGENEYKCFLWNYIYDRTHLCFDDHWIVLFKIIIFRSKILDDRHHRTNLDIYDHVGKIC